MSDYNAKNYTELGGERTVIGGTMEFTDEAEVVNMPETELPVASKSRFGLIKVGSGVGIHNGVLYGYILGGTELGGVELGHGLYIDAQYLTLNCIIKGRMPYIPKITEATLENLIVSINLLIQEMTAVGLMKPESQEVQNGV